MNLKKKLQQKSQKQLCSIIPYVQAYCEILQYYIEQNENSVGRGIVNN